MTAPTINTAQYRLESNVFEAVSLWLETETHRAYQGVIQAVRQLMQFFPEDSEMFFENAGARANPEVVDFLKLIRMVAFDFHNS